VAAKREEGSKEALTEALHIIEQAQQDKINSSALAALKTEIEESLKAVSHEYPITPSVFFDLELIKKDAVGKKMVLADGFLIITDEVNSAVYSLSIADKRFSILGGGNELTHPGYSAAGLGQVYVSADQGVFELSTSSKKQSLAVKPETKKQEILGLQSFGGNLYLLDKKGIWQYVAIENGFGTGKAWLKTEADFSQAKSMAIDGVIWVLASDGSVWKFVRGVKETFSLTGLDRSLTASQTISTAVEQNFLYILEDSRIVAFSKEGRYQAQYLWRDMKPVDLAVAEKEKKIFLLEGSKIYLIEIK